MLPAGWNVPTQMNMRLFETEENVASCWLVRGWTAARRGSFSHSMWCRLLRELCTVMFSVWVTVLHSINTTMCRFTARRRGVSISTQKKGRTHMHVVVWNQSAQTNSQKATEAAGQQVGRFMERQRDGLCWHRGLWQQRGHWTTSLDRELSDTHEPSAAHRRYCVFLLTVHQHGSSLNSIPQKHLHFKSCISCLWDMSDTSYVKSLVSIKI